MNVKTTVILVAVCVVAAVAWYLVSSDAEKGTAAAAGEVEKSLFDPKPEGADRIELVRRDGQKFVFVREGTEEWRMEAPLSAPASRWEVDAVRDAALNIKYVRKIDAGTKDRPGEAITGLDKPLATVTVKKGDTVQAAVKIGNRLPIGQGGYVQLLGSDDIYVTRTDLTRSFDKKLENFRDRRVLKFETKDVRRVKVEGLRNFELVQGSDEQWVLEAPVRARADKSKAQGLVSPLSALYVDQFLDDEPVSYKPYGLDKPRLKITVQTEETRPPKAKPGDPDTQPADTQPTREERTYVLMVGGATDTRNEAFFARLEGAPWVFSIRESTLKTLMPEVAELREKGLLEVDTARVRKIEAQTPGGQLVLTHGDDGRWRFPDETEADDAAVNDLLTAVKNLQASEFVDTRGQLMVIDWNRPQARISLTQTGELNPLTLLVGPPTATGKMVYVKNAAQDAVAAVREESVAQLIQPPAAYRDRRLMSFQTEYVNHVAIERTKLPSVRMSKKDGLWRMESPIAGAVDSDAIRTLLQDLSSLMAKRVALTGDRAEYGLDQPPVTVSLVVQMPPAVVAPPPTEPAAGTAEPTATEPPAGSGQPPAADAAAEPGSGSGAEPAAEPGGEETTPDPDEAGEGARAPAPLPKVASEDPVRQIEMLRELLESQKNNPEARPEVTSMLEKKLADLLATQPAAAAPSADAAAPRGSTPPAQDPLRELQVFKQLLDYQKTNPKENPLATKMLREELAAHLGVTLPEDAGEAARLLDTLLEQKIAELTATRPAAATTEPTATPPVAAAPPTPAPEPPPPIELKIMLSQKDGVTYAMVPNREVIYVVENKVYENCTAEFKDRTITQFATDEVTGMIFRHGGTTLTLRKAGDTWRLEEDPHLPIDRQKVTDVINAFRDLKTHRYVDYTTTDWEPFGLAGEAGDEVAFEMTAGRKITLKVAAGGPPEDPDQSRYAVRVGAEGVFLLKKDQAEKFRQKIEDFEKKGS